MKKLLLGAVGLVAALGFAAPAMAADLPAQVYKTPTLIPAYYDWSGLYIGLNGGGGSAHKCWDINNNGPTAVIPAVREGCHDATGALAGAQLGYRLQWSSFVVGIEAQGDWASLTGSNASLFPFATPTTNKTRVNALGLFTGQVGFAWDRVLGYVKGGAAIAGDRYTGVITANNVTFDRATEGRWGAALGAGVEFAFAQDWSVAFEYDHLFMGSRNLGLTTTTTNALSRYDSIRQDMDIGTVRVNYRWGGPVIAKY